MPNERLGELRLSFGAEAISCSPNVSADVPTLAVSVADSDEFTGETFAVKMALVAPAGTITELGTVTSELLLARLTANPPLAAAVFSVTVQLSVPDPMIDPFVQLSPSSPGTPVPLRPTTIDVPFDELLVSDSCPISAPAAPGANCRLNVVVCPGASVTGRPWLVMAKPAPVRDAALTVTGIVPVDERTNGCVTAELTGTVPKARLLALIPRMGIAAPSSTANVCATPPTLAVNVAACTVVTGEMLALKVALLAPVGTVTDAGTVTALSLLARATFRPPLAAVAFSVTVHVSLEAPVTDPITQFSPVSIGTPMPLKATEAELAFDALLAMVNWPVADPDAAGLNLIVTVTLAFAPTLMGTLLPPLIEKGCPVRVNVEISTAADPVFVSVMLVLTVLPTATWPKSIVLADMISVPVPVAVFVAAMEPPQPLRAMLQIRVSSTIKLNFKWRIVPPNGRKTFIGA